MRDRFAYSNNQREGHEKELELCLKKKEQLEAEVFLLLDVLLITIAREPSVAQYLNITPQLQPIPLPPPSPEEPRPSRRIETNGKKHHPVDQEEDHQMDRLD